MHDIKSNLRFIQLHLYLLFTKNMINQKIPKAKKSAAKGLLELPNASLYRGKLLATCMKDLFFTFIESHDYPDRPVGWRQNRGLPV